MLWVIFSPFLSSGKPRKKAITSYIETIKLHLKAQFSCLSALVPRWHQLWMTLGFVTFFWYSYSFIKLLHLPLKRCPADCEIVACSPLMVVSLTSKRMCQESAYELPFVTTTLWLWIWWFPVTYVLSHIHWKHIFRGKLPCYLFIVQLLASRKTWVLAFLNAKEFIWDSNLEV